jgi:hypothetical protein
MSFEIMVHFSILKLFPALRII